MRFRLAQQLLGICFHDGGNLPGLTMKVIEACHQAVHAMGCPRGYTTVKINTRTDKNQSLEDKVASVQALL